MNEAINSLWEKAFQKGYEEGYRKGKIEILRKLVSEGLISTTVAADQLKLSEEEFRKKYRG